MNAYSKLAYAIAAVLGTSALGLGYNARAATAADTAAEDEGIQEITVTATRRTESAQNVPITIQALTGETLTQLNVTTFDDFVKYTPNVTTAGAGPGQNSVFMRGLSVGVTGQQGTGSTGPIPNVAVYLDEQSGALPGRNLDVYAADMERIEVLEGPQGTLFGSGAQAGVLRYITNKPKIDTTEGNVDASYSYTAHGGNNASAEAMLNLPVIPGMLAIRGVIYTDSRGGYIDNQPATFTRSQTDEGFFNYNTNTPTYTLPLNSLSINNSNNTGNDINPVTYTGGRFEALLKINDDWNALLTQSYQNMNAQGVFYQMPNGPEGVTFDAVGQPHGGEPLGKLSVALFNPSYDKDKFENTSLVIDGKVLDFLHIVYSGGYLVRNIEQQQDYTNYARGVFGYYYQCAGYSKAAAGTGQCFTPSATWQETEKNTHMSHELRFSTPDDLRIRAIAGVYYEQFKIYDFTDWTYKSVPNCSASFDVNCFNPTANRPGETTNNPSGELAGDVGFVDDTQRTIIQKAGFGSLDVDVIPHTLTATIGTRYYRFDEGIKGGAYGSFYCKVFAATTYYGNCTPATNDGAISPYGTNLDLASYNHSVYKGFRSRGNLSWHIDEDLLAYATWSQGFRPGGFNRAAKATQPDANGIAQYNTPVQYSPDTLTNYEVGFKTEWLHHHLQVNGAVYREEWKNTIVEFFDPQQGFGNLTFSTNGPNYRVMGGELQVVAKPFLEGLTIQGSGSYNRSTETNSPYLVNNNPASPTFGEPLTQLPNVYGLKGSPLGQSPDFQGNMRVRYEFNLGDYHAFGQVGGQYFGPSYSAVGTVGNYYMPGYTTFDASAGIAKDAWNVSFFCQNCGDKNASTFTNSYQFVIAETVLRPRVAGVKIGYKF